ncbi:MAG: hypothetical protein KGQ41_02490 [Alphaproteobacteria bacterium]|nr:hypothetical protein [Alphaproteobacteria bacterium]
MKIKRVLDRARAMQHERMFVEATDLLIHHDSRTDLGADDLMALGDAFNDFATDYRASRGRRVSAEFFKAGRYPFLLNKAMICYKRASALALNDETAALKVVKIAMQLNMPASGFDYARKAVRINPLSVDGWTYLAILHDLNSETLRAELCRANAGVAATGKADGLQAYSAPSAPAPQPAA